jgi:hypothetical protein
MQIPLSNELNIAKSSSITTNSPYDYMSHRKGIKVQKVGHTLNGAGAQTDNIFTVTGAVEVVALWAECTEATNATTCTTAYFDLYDGAAALEITDNGGTSCSAITVGSVIMKSSIATIALTKLANGSGAILDGAANTATTFCPFTVIKKTGQTTYIRFCFTGDADTDIDMTFNIRYVPLTSDGAIASA